MDPEGARKKGEESFETGLDEFFKWVSQLNASNTKRDFDVFGLYLGDTFYRNRTHFDRMQTNAVGHDNELNKAAVQAIQNAVETANLVAKRNLERTDVAHDRVWNIDEVNYIAKEILRSDTYRSYMEGTIAAIVAKVLSELGVATKPAAG
jgi:hypothetical protein